MTTRITAQKIGDPLLDGRRILGDRWTSAIVGDNLWFVSLNGLNQPTFHTFHETPLLGGVVTSFDYRRRQWNKKEIVYDALSSEENLEGHIFGFRHTLLLLTYRKHGKFSYQQLYYWDTSHGKWTSNSLFIDPKTEIHDVHETELFLTSESDDYVYLITHDRSRGVLIVAQLDTVGGYGKPGPARIDFLFEISNESLKGDTASVCSVCVCDHRVWTLFFGHKDAPGSPARLLSSHMKNGHTEEIDLNAVAGGAHVFSKEDPSKDHGKYKCRLCNRGKSGKPTFSQGLCGTQWLFLMTSDHTDRELFSLDLREGRWRLLAVPERYRATTERAWAKNSTEIVIPADVEMAVWHDPDMEFYGISFENGVYLIDIKRILDEF